jgi:hypothetical protein
VRHATEGGGGGKDGKKGTSENKCSNFMPMYECMYISFSRLFFSNAHHGNAYELSFDISTAMHLKT